MDVIPGDYRHFLLPLAYWASPDAVLGRDLSRPDNLAAAFLPDHPLD
jgi:hypothetical protein